MAAAEPAPEATAAETKVAQKKKQIKHVKENPHEDPRIPEGPAPDYEMFDEFGNWKGD